MIARFPRPVLWLAAAGWLAVAGCGKKEVAVSEAPEPPAQEKPETSNTSNSTPAQPVSRPADFAGLHQSFLQATRKDAPPDQRPPDTTMTGKSIGKIYKQVVDTWDGIRFIRDDGTRLHYRATLETSEGMIEITLNHDAAPNHVRNFIALSRAGYYDGLVFDRIHHEESDLSEGSRYEEIEAGCPLGTGDPAANSVGYWLRPEFSKDATHEIGAVGACHGLEEDTGACKFYITLCKAPYLDGHYTVFGKVTRGLEIARKIFLQPVVLEDSDLNGSRRPLKPVVIHKVTIHCKEVPPSKEHVSRR